MAPEPNPNVEAVHGDKFGSVIIGPTIRGK